jgi:para-nitrobenzyl esterase
MDDLDVVPGAMSEDCLNLNLWTPALRDGAKRPVIVYLHGGGWTRLSANLNHFNGERLSRFGDVVVVTINHRLGVFGYINLVDLGAPEEFAYSGNAGMLDVVQALAWIRDNIENFGGDPSCVTVFGQSGGGRKTSVLMAMPAARGLFHRAGVQSGSSSRQPTREESAKTTRMLMKYLGIDRAVDLQRIAFDILVDAQVAIGVGPAAPAEFRSFVDGIILPDHPFDEKPPEVSADVPLLISYCLNDNAWKYPNFDLGEPELRDTVLQIVGPNYCQRVIDEYVRAYPNYSPYLIQSTIHTDEDLLQRVIAQADCKASQNRAPVWVYRMDWPSPWRGGAFGAVHGMDMCMAFLNTNHAALGHAPEGVTLTHKIASAWLAFARNGDPNTSDMPPWEKYTVERRSTMVVNHPTQRVVDDPNRAFRLLWKEITQATTQT